MSDAAKKPLKIISLQAENVKRLVAVRIDPKGNLVQITGRNGQGKTSVLDSIWWVLDGASNVQKTPIRKGQEKARIRLDMGELIATRTFTKLEGGDFSTTIMVESADGGRFTSPQKTLDALLGKFTFDPLEFAGMKPKEQFDALKALVPNYDFAKNDALNLADFAKRTAVNAEAKAKDTQAAAIAIPESTPAQRVDETAIVEEIAAVGAFNAELERRAERRTVATSQAAEHRRAADGHRAEAVALRTRAEAADAAAAAADAAAADLEKKLAAAPPLEEKKDPATIRARLDQAKRTNLAVEQSTRRATLLAEADDLAAQSAALTARMDERTAAKRAAIAAAKLPVEGIEFVDEAIHLNGVPFDQASDAERLRASMAIAMASNPRLRVLRVRDGSLLDEDGLRLVAEMAAEHDYQVWIEQVDSSGKVGFVIEDGHVRHAPEAAAQAAE